MSENKKTILVDAKLSVKKSPDLRKVQYKASAGLSDAEVIERYTLGEYNTRKDEEEGSEEEG